MGWAGLGWLFAFGSVSLVSVRGKLLIKTNTLLVTASSNNNNNNHTFTHIRTT